MKTLQTLGATALLAAAAAAHADPLTYMIDPTHTFVTFEISHFATSTNRGRFDKKEGTVMFDRAGRTGKVEITIDTTSVNTGIAVFDRHVQSKDVLNAAEFPTATFVADNFVFNGDKVTDVSGSLTMLGKTLPITLKAHNFNCYTSPLFKREVCGGDFDTTIQRSLWGVDYGLSLGFADAMRLLVQVEAIKQ
jgi:polyisoprenoid-binding protein YceI